MTTAATASAAGMLMGLGAPIALAAGNDNAEPLKAAAVAIATPAATANTVATVELNTVSAGEWEMETVVLEAGPAAPATTTANGQIAGERTGTARTAQTAEKVAFNPAASGSIVGTAMSYTGAPYRWGGTTPAGWDCIGFVRYVYAQHGVAIGGSTTSVLSVGKRVPYSQARPGDILYWPGHVAISLGNGMNVGAWNPSLGTTTGPDSAIGTPVVIRVF
ncbi:C40 family peptidase [Trueperella pecoris]|uniref:C40 family peptidase n=1 Tax=Trueperella pecoris TaxID=2733571 RepID=A0A7M1QTE2_9ACTO|nr:C40 family peptidase [Trueperella pecoris]QOQ38097.1 C40 family peptidase [Trueperella pecoris]QOR45412.1 C40 family peptidase [Trueperella pecoris]QTG75296.1 C40 family peptidase [Trueperella pecoris]